MGTLAACVTVNVNFPESAVQKATDDYVRELYRAKKRPTEPQAEPAPAPTSSWFQGFELIPSAVAEEIPGGALEFKVDAPSTAKIRESMRSRLEEVLRFKREGILGESVDGRLAIKDQAKFQSKKLLMKKIDQLMSDENRDRERLYQEVLSLNQLPPARLKNIRKSFSRSFQNESPSGTWVESKEGVWEEKP
jgi:uncharacterized protein YdbL (DUF1318 family)